MPRAKITVTSEQAWRDFIEGAAYASTERMAVKRLALNNISESTNMVIEDQVLCLC